MHQELRDIVFQYWSPSKEINDKYDRITRIYKVINESIGFFTNDRECAFYQNRIFKIQCDNDLISEDIQKLNKLCNLHYDLDRRTIKNAGIDWKSIYFGQYTGLDIRQIGHIDPQFLRELQPDDVSLLPDIKLYFELCQRRIVFIKRPFDF